MDLFNTLSTIFTVLSIAASVTALLWKGKNMIIILMLLVFGNLFTALSYLCVGNYNGSISCFVGLASALINFFFSIKGKKIPVFLTAIYALAFIGVNLVGFIFPNSIFAIFACLCCVMSMVQPNGKMFRIWMVANNLFWCCHDVLAKTYQPLAIHLILLTFAIAGMIIHDIKKSVHE